METKNKLFNGLLELRSQQELHSKEWKQVDKLIQIYFKIQEEEIEELQEKIRLYERK